MRIDNCFAWEILSNQSRLFDDSVWGRYVLNTFVFFCIWNNINELFLNRQFLFIPYHYVGIVVYFAFVPFPIVLAIHSNKVQRIIFAFVWYPITTFLSILFSIRV